VAVALHLSKFRSSNVQGHLHGKWLFKQLFLSGCYYLKMSVYEGNSNRAKNATHHHTRAESGQNNNDGWTMENVMYKRTDKVY
jgi:hypothetical protein